MKKNSVFLKLRIKIGEIAFLLRPIFLFFRDLFRGQAVPSEKIINLGSENRHVFFGYYDITPFRNDDKLLLAMHCPPIDRAPEMKDEAEVGYYDLEKDDRSFVLLGETNTWCWQQGCRLQWYGEKKNKITYNCLTDGEYGALVRNISGEVVKKINRPLYSVSGDGQWGLSLDFSRLQRLRPGYGYSILPEKSINDPRPDDNGIELVDLETNESRQIFSLKDISGIEPHESMGGAEHYFNHLMFNPSGNKFLFFHLWMSRAGKRHSRLFVADRDGSNLKLLNNSGSVSHYNWISEDEIILYSLVREKEKYTYAVFNSSDGSIRYFGKNVPKGDGHPTILRNGETLITDTYPGRLSQRSVLGYNIKKDKTKVIARVDDPKNFAGEFRCDLHPRISHDKKTICVDRIVDSRRNISLIPFNIDSL